MEDTGLIEKLRRAGIPKEALGTTLVKEKCKEMRRYVESGEYQNTSIVFVSPLAGVLPFYTMAKELVLSGKTVHCYRLVDIHTALFKDTDEAEGINAALGASDFIAIEGFFDVGGRVEPFFTPYESAYFISWFIRQHQQGKGFLLHGADTLTRSEQWWPSSFVAYLRKRSVAFVVGSGNE